MNDIQTIKETVKAMTTVLSLIAKDQLSCQDKIVGLLDTIQADLEKSAAPIPPRPDHTDVAYALFKAERALQIAIELVPENAISISTPERAPKSEISHALVKVQGARTHLRHFGY